jgi:hypothetical protein
MPKLTGIWEHRCYLTNKTKYGYTIFIQPTENRLAAIGSFYGESLGDGSEIKTIQSFNWSGLGQEDNGKIYLTYFNEIDEGISKLEIIDGSSLKGTWESKKRVDRGREEFRKISNTIQIIPFNPIFSGRAVQMESQIFVLMPFAKKFIPIYKTVQKAAGDLNLKCFRADEIFSSNSAIINDIWVSILSSRAIIAELTSGNPNVFYELGIAHCLGKEVVLLAHDSLDIPFDLRHMRTIIYRKRRDLYTNLVSNLKDIIKA